MAAFEKTKAENDKLKNLTDKIDKSRLIQPEERERIAAELVEYSRMAEAARNDAERLREAKAWRENITKTEAELEATRLKFEKKTAVKAAFSPQAERLELHRKAAPLFGEFDKLDGIVAETSLFRQEREAWEARLPELQAAMNVAETNALLAAEARNHDKALFDETLPLIESAEKLDWEIAAKTKTLGEEETKAAKLTAELSRKQQELQDAQTKLEQEEYSRNELGAWLEANAAAADLRGDISAIESAIGQLNSAQKRLAEKEKATAELRAELEKLGKARATAETSAAEKEQAAAEADAETENNRAVFGEILGEFTVETLVAAANAAAETKNQTARLLERAKYYAEKQAELHRLRADFQQRTADKKARQDEEKAAKTALEEAEKTRRRIAENP